MDLKVCNPPPFKRKRSESDIAHLAPSPKRQKESCVELGSNFVGAIFIQNRKEADEVARQIYTLPVPPKCYSETNSICVEGLNVSTQMGWLGVGYPSKTTHPDVVDLYAIACGMKSALDFIDNTAYAVSCENPVASSFFPPGSTRTMSHTHDMKREVIMFTDDVYALQRLNGTIWYKVAGTHASLVKTNCDLSQLLAQKDIHLELHLSPGHGDVLGNEAAHDMSRRTEAELNPSRTGEARNALLMDQQQKGRPVLGLSLSFARPEVTGAPASPLSLPSHLSLGIRPKDF